MRREEEIIWHAPGQSRPPDEDDDHDVITALDFDSFLICCLGFFLQLLFFGTCVNRWTRKSFGHGLLSGIVAKLVNKQLENNANADNGSGEWEGDRETRDT